MSNKKKEIKKPFDKDGNLHPELRSLLNKVAIEEVQKQKQLGNVVEDEKERGITINHIKE